MSINRLSPREALARRYALSDGYAWEHMRPTDRDVYRRQAEEHLSAEALSVEKDAQAGAPAQTDTQALDRLAAWLWQDGPDGEFPSGADCCEELDDALRSTGRSPESVAAGG